MKNKIQDLRNHLFAQLERLGDETLTPAQLEQEVTRAAAMQGVASVIVQSAKVEVDFMKNTGSAGTGFIPETDWKRGISSPEKTGPEGDK